MADMLVRLYALPEVVPMPGASGTSKVHVRRPGVWEKTLLLDWVTRSFSAGWALECEAAFMRQPASCFIAVAEERIVGFACHDCTRPNFFGPTGIDPEWRGQGIGTVLLLAALHAMKDAGYAYAIIGGVGPASFYERAVGAVAIAGSTPGIYHLSLKS